MPDERENLYQPLTYTEYDIQGNTFRAYYDADDKLVMVLDFVTSDVKPNVLLVINPVGERKWDDILMNDYAVDLETVRPKKDNKYQKLDIEYTGLAQYDNLVRAYKAGDDVSPYLDDLARFRNVAARRAAMERMGGANVAAERARDTIEKTGETIDSLQKRQKTLRAKLAELRRGIGKEPTKQSAAKILRTESQIDATNDKLARARKRLGSAKRRLATAEEEVEIAQEIVSRLDAGVVENKNNLPAMPVATDVAEFEVAPVPMATVPQFTDITQFNEPTEQEQKAEDMADEEVKPLFDKDPEILDEEIAFKPIDFNVPADNSGVAPSMTEAEVKRDIIAPISFTPPVQSQPVEPIAAPVLDSLTPMDTQPEQIAPELLSMVGPEPLPQLADVTPAEPVAPVAPDYGANVDVLPSQAVQQSMPQSTMPEISPAPVDAGTRPVSPISGNVPDMATAERRKPTMMYYVLLILLIVMSVFTLWIYQKSANKNVPELGAETKVEVETVQEKETLDVPSPFIMDETKNVAPEKETEVNVEPVLESVEPDAVEVGVADVVSDPVPVTPAEPVQIVQSDVVVPIEATPEPTDDVQEPVTNTIEENSDSPFLSDETVTKEPTEPLVDILLKKPIYNVSQNEKMFVADPEYETDVVAEVAAPVQMDEAVQQETVETCADGQTPDADGCCSGEELVDMGDGTVACCAVGTDECFPPMF